jgi:hypothetical protein
MKPSAIRAFVLLVVLAAMWAIPSAGSTAGGQMLKFEVTLSPALNTGKLTGRLIVVVSTTNRTSELSQMNSVTNLNPSFCYSTTMDGKLRRRVLGIGNFHNIAASRGDGSPVAYLASGFTIKRRLGCQKVDFHTLDDLRFTFASRIQREHFRFSLEMIIADEFDSSACRKLDRIRNANLIGNVNRNRARFPASRPLLFHQLFETVTVDGHSLIP